MKNFLTEEERKIKCTHYAEGYNFEYLRDLSSGVDVYPSVWVETYERADIAKAVTSLMTDFMLWTYPYLNGFSGTDCIQWRFHDVKKVEASEEEKLPVAHIVYNAIRTPDGTVIESKSVHDFVTHVDANGETYGVDGGTLYLRRTGTGYEELSMTDQSPFQDVRQVMKWGTYGKNGDEPLRYIALKDMEEDHINAILATQKQLPEWKRDLFKKELMWRQQNG